MNASTLFWRYSHYISYLSELIFGNISWRRPRWLCRIGDGWTRLERAHPRLIAPAVITVFFVSCAGAWTWNWYSHRPKPHRVQVTIAPVPITKLEKELKFPPLIVHFSDHAARLEDLQKRSLSGVHLNPKIAGARRWSADDMVLFDAT
jgi:hypothetical protein